MVFCISKCSVSINLLLKKAYDYYDIYFLQQHIICYYLEQQLLDSLIDGRLQGNLKQTNFSKSAVLSCYLKISSNSSYLTHFAYSRFILSHSPSLKLNESKPKLPLIIQAHSKFIHIILRHIQADKYSISYLFHLIFTLSVSLDDQLVLSCFECVLSEPI